MPDAPAAKPGRLREGPAQRRRRAVQVARELASAGGYGAVTMREVARRAGIARATLYRYFSSKDHLLAEVMLEWGDEVKRLVRARPPTGRTAAERVAEVFTVVLEAAEREPRLLEALVSTSLSSDPAARGAQGGLAGLAGEYLDTALGSQPVGDREDLAVVLRHVVFALIIGMSAGRADARSAIRDLRTTARLLLERP